MRIVSILPLLLLFGTTSSESRNLSKIIEKLSSISRIANWIAIQTNPLGMEQLIVIPKIDTDKIKGKLEGIRNVGRPPAGLLHLLTANSSDLLRISQTPLDGRNVSDVIRGAEESISNRTLNTSSIRALRKSVGNIREGLAPDQMKLELLAIKEIVKDIDKDQNDIDMIRKEVKRFSEAGDVLEMVGVLNGSRRRISEDLGALGNGLKALIPLVEVLEALGPYGPPQVDLRLPNATDLEDPWIQGLLGSREEMIQQISDFSKEIQTLMAAFSPSFSPASSYDLLKVLDIIHLENAIRNATNCWKLFQPPVSTINIEQVQSIRNYTKGIERAAERRAVMLAIRKGLVDFNDTATGQEAMEIREKISSGITVNLDEWENPEVFPVWKDISNIDNVFRETHSADVFTCFKGSHFDGIEAIDRALELGGQAESVKGQVLKRIEGIPIVKGVLERIGAKMGKYPRIENSRLLATHVRRGIDVIDKMHKVLDLNDQKTDNTTTSAVISSIRHLDTVAGELIADGGLSVIWTIFQEALHVPLGTQLNFTASAQSDLDAAYRALPMLRHVFDTFFHASVDQKITPTSSILIMLAIIAVIIIIITAVSTGGYFGFKGKSEKRKLTSTRSQSVESLVNSEK